MLCVISRDFLGSVNFDIYMLMLAFRFLLLFGMRIRAACHKPVLDVMSLS
jgi:hypothetical protein